ncbi:MAG: DUF559 domain-containing protein [bacterium]
MKSTLKPFAKKLRKNSTDTESLLWRHLRAKRFEGFKWRRQEPVGKYIVDFICYEKRVIIECDGGQHLVEREKDRVREEWLGKRGYRMLRFWDHEILQDLEAVLEAIWKGLMGHPPPDPRPPRAGEKERE